MKIKLIPLFSENPVKEANEVGSLFPLGTEGEKCLCS